MASKRGGVRATGAVVAGVRAGAVVIRSVWTRCRDTWGRLRAPQQLVLGFAAYALLGAGLLCLPVSVTNQAGVLDHLFSAVSAVTTTGLSTLSVPDTYSFFGELVLLALFQAGGIGFMTVSSVFVLSRGRPLSDGRIGVLRAGFTLPRNFVPAHFIRHVVIFTALCEVAGAMLLWWRFDALGVESPLWSAVFHSVSAFATAGFSLNNTSLEAFRSDWVINAVIAALCYLGGMGFIVAQDVWYSIRLRERMLTFTSRMILLITAAVFVLGTAGLFFLEPTLRSFAPGDRLMAAAFQVMSASTTAGFNTVPIGAMSAASLVVVVAAMVIGASPSGTGGGIKTTSVSALAANLMSVLRGRDRVVLFRHEIPLPRVLSAAAATTVYAVGMACGVLLLAITEDADFLPVVFEAASAIGTVGLSMGLTGSLTAAGKVAVIVLMFAGRCGPLTIGLALLQPQPDIRDRRIDDLAT